MKKQKKTMIALLIIAIIALIGYFALKSYGKKTEEEETATKEADKIYLSKINIDDIASFSYQTNGEYLTFSKLEDQWICSEYQDIDLDEDKVDNIAGAFSDVEAVCIVDNPMEKSEYGLDSPDLNISVTTNEGNTFIFAIGNANDITGDYYLYFGEDDNVYMVASSFISNFDLTIEDLTAEEEAAENTTEGKEE